MFLSKYYRYQGIGKVVRLRMCHLVYLVFHCEIDLGGINAN